MTASLGLGTAAFGQRYGIRQRMVDARVAREILDEAHASGIEVIDTAPAYGDSEALLGSIAPEGTRFRFVTKTVPPAPSDVRSLREAALASLERLRVPSLAGLLVHRPDELSGKRGRALVEALCSLKADGLVEKLGVSVYETSEIDAAASLLPLEIVQLPLNVLDQRARLDGTIERLSAAGVEVHARSPFMQGVLLMPPSMVPSRLRDRTTAFARFHAARRTLGVTAIQACLGMVATTPGVEVVLVGATSLREVRQCAAAVREPQVLSGPDLACGDPDVIDPRRWN